MSNQKDPKEIQAACEESGRKGEATVAYVLSHLGPNFNVLNNVLLNKTSLYDRFKPKGKLTTQIDHIVVSNYGVWVIETKNHTGRIYGSDYDTSWLQVLPSGDYNEFYSPVEQNCGHCTTIRKMLDLPVAVIFGFVVFSNGHVDLSNVKSWNCYTLSTMKDAIHKGCRLGMVLTNADVYNILQKIQANRLYSKSAEDTHAKRVNNIKNYKYGHSR